MHSTTITNEINAQSSPDRNCLASKCTGGCGKTVPIAAFTPGWVSQHTNPVDYQCPLAKETKNKTNQDICLSIAKIQVCFNFARKGGLIIVRPKSYNCHAIVKRLSFDGYTIVMQ